MKGVYRRRIITQAILNTQLYQKMFAEQDLFKAELMQLPSEEILRQAYNMSAGKIYYCRWNTMTSCPGRQRRF